MNVYDVNSLRNDYHFLEDALQCKQGAKRTLNSLLNRDSNEGNESQESKHRKKTKHLFKSLSLESIQENKMDSNNSISSGIMYQNILEYSQEVQQLIHAVSSRLVYYLLG